MTTRQLSMLPSVRRTAVLSDCELYRYSLTRCWDLGNTRADVAWIMLNPSTADAEVDDATIRRCIGFSKREGYGGLVVVNLFALRSTNPRNLRHAEDPVGPDNRAHILRTALHADRVICAWGTWGAMHGRGHEMLHQLYGWGIVPWHFGKTANGHPKHPLRLRKDARLTRLPFKPTRERP